MNKKDISAYNTDASRLNGRAEKVFFPKSTKEVQELIKITNLDIVPRGAGTGFVGGAIPNVSIVVDMTKMNKIIGFNPQKRLLVVESGIILKELNEKLRAKGYEFPIDLLNKGISSLGGMISTNASGKRAMKYGTVRDWLDEIEFVNGKGEIIKTSKADLMDVCGMEGITGIITSAKIRVMPLVHRSFSIFQSDSIDDVLHVARKLKQEKEVCSIILFSKEISKYLEFPNRYNLIVEFDSLRGKIKGIEYEELLKKIENIFYTLGINDYYNSEDPKFFYDKIKEFTEILEENNVPYFSYLGTGIIQPFFKDSEKEKRARIMDIVKRMQGKLGKYGYGIKRKDFLDSFESKLIQRVKQRHDPGGKLNRGKLIEGFSSYVKRTEVVEEKGVLKDRFKEERLDIRPNLGEEISAKNISNETKEKTPEEKMQELIKEAEKVEVCDINPVKSTLASGLFNPAEQTDLSSFEKKEVEQYARGIPREIIKTTDLPLKQRLDVDYEQLKESVEHENKKPSPSKEEQDLINKIMGNRYKEEKK